MKEVLFVCVNNVGRSQMAESIYNETRPGQAESAGTTVDEPDGVVGDWAGGPELIMQVQNENGPDISRNKRTQLTEDMLQEYGRVIIMAQSETWPAYLQIGGHINQWVVHDPVNMSVEEIRRIHALVKVRVEELLSGFGKQANQA